MTTPRITWSWQISLGNVVTAATAVAFVAIAYTNLQRNDADHDRRIAATEMSVQRAAENHALQSDHARRIAVLETTASRAVDRLNALDVERAALNAKFERIDELMTEVRDQLRILTGGQNR